MAVLLLKLHGIKSLNRTFFAPYLFVFDDFLIYKKGKFFGKREITLSYNHIVQVNLNKGLIFSTIEIINTGAENIRVKWVLNRPAIRAKQIIDQKVYHVHKKANPLAFEGDNQVYHNLEKSINRLRELEQRGKISRGEFKKKRKHLLKNLR